MINPLSPPKVLIFDSGVGGLSIVDKVMAQHPSVEIIYASDNAAFPYGTKSTTEVIHRAEEVLHRLQEESQADIIVIACNTASTVALPKIRARFSQPVVGVVPAIKPAAEASHSKVIGLLATPGTVSRDYTQDLINSFAHDCQVIPVGSSALVQLAEDKLKGMTIDQQEIAKIVKPFTDAPQLDAVVLACTHFPLLIDELKLTLPQVHYWVDSSDAIARRVGHWLDKLIPGAQEDGSTAVRDLNHRSFFTANNAQVQALLPALSHYDLNNLRIIHLPYQQPEP